jgi:hypothetical protein
MASSPPIDHSLFRCFLTHPDQGDSRRNKPAETRTGDPQPDYSRIPLLDRFCIYLAQPPARATDSEVSHNLIFIPNDN